MSTETSEGERGLISSNLLYAECECNYRTLVALPEGEKNYNSVTIRCPKCPGTLDISKATDLDVDLPVISYKDLIKSSLGWGDEHERSKPEVLRYLLSTRRITDVTFQEGASGKVLFHKITLEDGTVLHFSSGYVYKTTYERSK